MSKLTPASEKLIISETIAALALHPTQIAAANSLKIDEATLYRRMKTYPEIKQALAEAKERAADILLQATPKAANVVVTKLDDRRQDFEAAKYILDGVGVTTKKTATGVKFESGDMKMEFISYDES